MKIKSEFKDYYDYQSTIYGVDNTITYDRKRIVELDNNSLDREPDLQVTEIDDWLSIPYLDYYDRKKFGLEYYNFYWLVIGESAMLIASYTDDLANTKYTLVTEDHPTYRMPEIKHYVDSNNLHPNTKELCRIVGHPVFIVSTVKTNYRNRNLIINIKGRCPILKEINGLPSKYPADQIYQDLNYFLLNTINPTPDQMGSSIPLTDKEKIIQHGMDVKQSFRHRK